MKNIDFKELLEYYNGFDFNSGESKLIENFNLEKSKELAYNEIKRRTLEYREMNQIQNKTSTLKSYESHFLNLIKNPKNLFFIQTSWEVFNLIQKLEEYSNKKYASEALILKKKIEDVKSELINLWELDPDNLRYQSKFGGNRLSQQYYSSEIGDFKIIFSSQLEFNYKISQQLQKHYLEIIISESIRYDLVIYPIFLKSKQGYELLLSFVLNHYSLNTHYSKLVILLIMNSSNDERQELNTVAKEEIISSILTKIQYTPINIFLIDNVCNESNLEELLENLNRETLANQV